MNDADARAVADALLLRDKRAEPGWRAFITGLFPVFAGLVLATQQKEPLYIAIAAGSVPFLVVFLGRATARAGFAVPLLVAQAIALVLGGGCTAAMVDADTAAEEAFERLWLISMVVGSLAGAMLGHLVGTAAAGVFESILGGRTARTPDAVIARRMAELEQATKSWTAPAVELEYETGETLELQLDERLMAARGYRRMSPGPSGAASVVDVATVALDLALGGVGSGSNPVRVTFAR